MIGFHDGWAEKHLTMHTRLVIVAQQSVELQNRIIMNLSKFSFPTKWRFLGGCLKVGACRGFFMLKHSKDDKLPSFLDAIELTNDPKLLRQNFADKTRIKATTSRLHVKN